MVGQRNTLMVVKYRLAIAAAIVLATPSPVAAAGEAGEFTFTVLQDGNPVGQHRFMFERQGDRVEIQETTEIEISFATIPLYTFEHEKRAVWRNGRALRIDALTNDNGEKLDISVRDTGRAYVRTVNGRVDRFDESRVVMAYWNPDTLHHDSFFSAIEDKTLDATFRYVGSEPITVAGRRVEAQHYHLAGDDPRELWFDPEGRVAKIAFRRYGTTIEYVRDQLEPEAPPSTCMAIC
jgi:hypothetical protein